MTPPYRDPHQLTGDPDTEAERVARLRREVEMLAKGRAQLDTAQGRTGRDLDAWLEAWEGNGDLPPRRAT